MPALPTRRLTGFSVPLLPKPLVLGARHGVSPAAFGSLLWQYLTGLGYLSPRSDIDVLWPVPTVCDIGSLLVGITEAERLAPMRIDGEVVFPDGNAVNWRELRNALNQSMAAQRYANMVRVAPARKPLPAFPAFTISAYPRCCGVAS